jgi:mannose-6-phosphate isomerase-like protein (cupin superfamily)
VVTGHDASGRSVFASDEAVAPITLELMPGAEFHRLWSSDGPQTYPGDGREPVAPAYFPGVGGFRFGLFTIPPQHDAPYPDDLSAAMAEIEAKLPGMLAVMEPDDPGMHTTDTTDFEVVLSGEVVLELDDGAEVTLRPGDTVVQNGTRHRWSNRGDVPAVLAVCIVGAQRR